MRIAILTPSYFPFYKGAERIIHSLSKELARRGHKVFLLCPNNCGPVGDERGVKVLPILRKGWDRDIIINSLIVLKVLCSAEVDLLHIHFAYPYGLIGIICRILLGLPYVITSHGWDIQIDQPTQYGARLKPRFALQIWLTLKLANAHTIVGKQMLQEAVGAGSHPSRVFCVPPGIPLPTNNEGATRLFNPKIKEDDIVILFVGRLVKKKGVIYLVRASQRVLREVPKSKLVIVGEGAERTKLIEDSRHLGVSERVLFLGEVSEEEKVSLLKRADIYAYPSYKEGLSLSLLEAMAYGKALVLSRIPSFTEVLSEEEAIFFDAGNVAQLVKAIVDLAESPKKIESLSRKAIEKSVNYLETVMVTRYEQIYRDIAA